MIRFARASGARGGDNDRRASHDLLAEKDHDQNSSARQGTKRSRTHALTAGAVLLGLGALAALRMSHARKGRSGDSGVSPPDITQRQSPIKTEGKKIPEISSAPPPLSPLPQAGTLIGRHRGW